MRSDQLLEVGALTLRFDLNETCQFPVREGIGRLGSSDVRAIQVETEGWSAILCIIASSEEFGQFAQGWCIADARPRCHVLVGADEVIN